MSIVHANPARAGETPADDAVAFINVGDGLSRAGSPSGTSPAALRRSSGSAAFARTWSSTKASALAEWAADTGRAVLRFDYSGHGRSDGRFEGETIGRWLEELLGRSAALAGATPLLVGSSMGGWLALLAAASDGQTRHWR